MLAFVEPQKREHSRLRDYHSAERRLRWLLMILLMTIGFSTIGYRIIEGGSLVDALYMTVITIATVGFREVYPLSEAGKVFTIFVIVFSTVILAYTIGTLGQLFVEGQIREILGRRKMEKKIRKLKDHFIIVGYGRVGQMVYSEIAKAGEASVVIESDPEMLDQLERDGALYIEGSAIEDEIMLQAGIKQAKCLVDTIPDDADSVFISLSARQFNPKLYIIARADSKSGEKKLLRAGADRVILPYEIGGKRMAMASLRPNVVDFMTLESFGAHLGLSIEEVEIFRDAQIEGKTLKEVDLRSKYGLTVIGIKKPSGDLQLHPPAGTRMDVGDILVLIGQTENLERISELCSVKPD
jgi:voltage-gated potassium channel